MLRCSQRFVLDILCYFFILSFAKKSFFFFVVLHLLNITTIFKV